MKLGLQLSEADAQLKDDELVAKGLEALKKALKQARPALHVHVHDHALDGGDMQFVGDIADKMATAYAQRCERMLQDVADFLMREHPEAGGRS